MRPHSCVQGPCLVCLKNEIHAAPLLCPGFLFEKFSGLKSCGPPPMSWVLVWLVLWVKFMLFHSCALGSCLVGLVVLWVKFMLFHSCSLNSCFVFLLGCIRAVPLVCVLWVNFMASHSCVLDSCLVYLLTEIHAVPLLCLGFLSGLSYGWVFVWLVSTSCGPIPVSWVLVWLDFAP